MRWVSLVSGAATFALYAATGARHHPPDAMVYAMAVQEGNLPIPGHLLYNHAGALAVAALRSLEPMSALQLLNAGGGAVAVGCLTSVVERSTGRAMLALVVGLGAASTWGLWHLNTTWEVHVWPVALLLAALLLIVRGAPAWAMGVALGTAGLLHASSALAAPGVAAGAWLSGPRRSRPPRLRSVEAVRGAREKATRSLVVACVSSAMVALAYWGVYGARIVDPAGPPPAAGDALAFRLSELGKALARTVVYVGPERCGDVGAAAGFLGPAASHALLGLGVLWGVAAVLVARSRLLEHRPLLAMTGLWAVAGGALGAWFEPGNFEYLLGPMLGIIAALGVATGSALDRLPRWCAPVALGAMATFAGFTGAQNLWGDVLPAARGPAHVHCEHGTSAPPDGGGFDRPRPGHAGRHRR